MITLTVAGVVWMRGVVMPRRPPDAAAARPRRIPEGEPRPTADGKGLRIVVNPSSGPPHLRSPLDQLHEALPAADLHELGENDDLADLLADTSFGSIGAAGGDGTLAAAAATATARDATFVAVPTGTLNHLARDLGLENVDDAIAAVQAGYAVSMDVGEVAGRIFVNTLSFGGYAAVVDRREQLQRFLGKWPALLVALVWELPRMEPLHVEIDGQPMKVWLAWVGNCAYSPRGLAPMWRERLDDGLLDVRIVHGARRFSRTRFTAAALAGRLPRCHVYSERTAERLDVTILDGPTRPPSHIGIASGESLRVAADGETFDAPATFTVSKQRRALRVVVPAPD